MMSTPSILKLHEIIVSSQAVAGSALQDPEALSRIGVDAVAGGAGALRIAGVDTLKLSKSRVNVPIVGLIKTERDNFEPRITAT
jgi:N-acylglucosamine-6-phosphate 2-epimerase